MACLLIRDILQTSLAPSNPAHISTSLSSLRQQPQNDARKLSLHLSWLAKSLPPLKGSSVRRHVLTLLTGRAVIRVVEWSEIEGDAWKIVNVKSMLVALRHRYMERAGLEPRTDQRHNGYVMRCPLLVPLGFSRPRRMEPRAQSLISFLCLPPSLPSPSPTTIALTSSTTLSPESERLAATSFVFCPSSSLSSPPSLSRCPRWTRNFQHGTWRRTS